MFQSSNPVIVHKTMKPIDSFEENDYRLKREKNNESVRKSREKNKIKVLECKTHVQELHNENQRLNQTLENLQGELFTLKNLFQHVFPFNPDNLPVKPKEIPTSTLYKIIMKNNANHVDINEKLKFVPTNPASPSTSLSTCSSPTSSFSAAAASPKDPYDSNFNETDHFYYNQIKSALSSINPFNGPKQTTDFDNDDVLEMSPNLNLEHDYSINKKNLK